MTKPNTILAVHYVFDPSAAIVRDGKVLAYSEEERHTRQKHEPHVFPKRAVQSCLELADLEHRDITHIAVNWDLEAFNTGKVEAFFERMRQSYDVDPATRGWQNAQVASRQYDTYTNYLATNWYDMFGTREIPEVISFPHHYSHAFHAFTQSGFDEALCLTTDGSGDMECTVLWACKGNDIKPLRQFDMPNSLGWFYSAFTEYLGFKAYDGEYKIMGMASYGHEDVEIEKALSKVLSVDKDSGTYRVDPTFIHYGPHSYSSRYTDHLVKLLGIAARHATHEITQWHRNLAFAVQKRLEEALCAVVQRGIQETGLHNLCIGGGVGLNVKANAVLATLPQVAQIYCNPLCSDSGAVCGTAQLASWRLDSAPPERQTSLALGHYETSETIRQVLHETKLSHTEYSFDQIPDIAAEALSQGKIIGWFQGRMEAGPRALGQRSILANPKTLAARDQVNAVIKYRELWRPFCPSILEEASADYFDGALNSPFMIMSYPANERLKSEAPAVVHVDGTCRVQTVSRDVLPLFHALIARFGEKTGTPVVMNTSFNVAGEPIVATAQDAIRTFYATAMDMLVIENFVLRK